MSRADNYCSQVLADALGRLNVDFSKTRLKKWKCQTSIEEDWKRNKEKSKEQLVITGHNALFRVYHTLCTF